MPARLSIPSITEAPFSSTSTRDLPSAAALIRHFGELADSWVRGSLPDDIPDAECASFYDCAERLLACNTLIWNAESRIRTGKPAPASVVAEKRLIDIANIRRSELVERLDDICLAVVEQDSPRDLDGAFLNSETIGQLCDRLSIFELKIRHHQMKLEAAKDPAGVSANIEALEAQRTYVAKCYDRFLGALLAGEAAMLSYRQFKQYTQSEIARS